MGQDGANAALIAWSQAVYRGAARWLRGVFVEDQRPLDLVSEHSDSDLDDGCFLLAVEIAPNRSLPCVRLKSLFLLGGDVVSRVRCAMAFLGWGYLLQ